MKVNLTYLVVVIAAFSLWLGACAKSTQKGAQRQAGTGGQGGAGGNANGKVANEDILERNQERFRTCQEEKLENLISVESLSKNTLTGKNLEKILSAITGKSNLKQSLDELSNSRKDLYANITNRINLVNDIIVISKELDARNKYLLFEGLLEALFSTGDKSLTSEEAKQEANKLEKSATGCFDNSSLYDDLNAIVERIKSDSSSAAGGSTTLTSLKNELSEKIKSNLADQKKSIEAKISRINTISDRIHKKDKNLRSEYDSISRELTQLTGTLEMKACSQMIIEKTGKKGDMLTSYLKGMKTIIELESGKDLKTSGNREL